MTVAEILQQVIGEYESRNQITLEQARRYLNIAQQLCFNVEKKATMVYSQFVTVVDGTLTYDMPTYPACRRFIGVTKSSPEVILDLEGSDAQQYEEDVGLSTDYGFVSNDRPRDIYEKITVDVWNKQFTFLETPSTEADTYRMVYYFGAPTINNDKDDANLLVPAEFHWTVLVQAMIKMADNDIFGKDTPESVLQPILQPFHTFMDNLTNEGNLTNYISKGQVL